VKYYKVVCEESCGACLGNGVITNPIYRKMWADFDRVKNIPPVAVSFSDEWQKDWATKHGYQSVDGMGGEVEQCLECKGKGRTRKEVPLQEALVYLGALDGI
jgi:hypothetical protein